MLWSCLCGTGEGVDVQHIPSKSISEICLKGTEVIER